MMLENNNSNPLKTVAPFCLDLARRLEGVHVDSQSRYVGSSSLYVGCCSYVWAITDSAHDEQALRGILHHPCGLL